MDGLSSYSHPLIPAPSNSVFASLHRRTRTADAPGAQTTKNVEARDAAVRDAKRFLLQVVRTDWAYPAPETQSADPTETHDATESLAEEPRENVIGWRHREQEFSSSEPEESPGDATVRLDPYRFDSPDAVAQSMADRRRKRRRLVEDEMKWNEGLQLWMARRDAWTGAKVVTPSVTATGDDSAKLEPGTEAHRQSLSSSEGSYSGSYDTDNLLDTESQYTLSRPASNASASAHLKSPAVVTVTAPPEDEKPGVVTISLEEQAAVQTPTGVVPAEALQPEVDDECLVPVMGPLIPDSNMLRAAITPNVYPALYSRLVIQSNTPAVPINLAHMTRALVQGWKNNDEWPPKPTPSTDVPLVKRPKPATSDNTHTNLNNNVNESNELRDGKGRRLSGVSNAVKKVLGISSFNPGSRLHIRSNSHSGSVARPPTEEGV